MEIEHDMKMLPINESLEEKVQKLQAEGWNLVPGFQPMAVYALFRAKKQQDAGDDLGPKLNLHIDEEGIGVLRNGQLTKN